VALTTPNSTFASAGGLISFLLTILPATQKVVFSCKQKKEAAFRQLIYIVRVESRVFQNPPNAKLQTVTSKRLTRTLKLNSDNKIQFLLVYFIISWRQFRNENYQLNVLTSLNSADLSADNKLRL